MAGVDHPPARIFRLPIFTSKYFVFCHGWLGRDVWEGCGFSGRCSGRGPTHSPHPRARWGVRIPLLDVGRGCPDPLTSSLAGSKNSENFLPARRKVIKKRYVQKSEKLGIFDIFSDENQVIFNNLGFWLSTNPKKITNTPSVSRLEEGVLSPPLCQEGGPDHTIA